MYNHIFPITYIQKNLADELDKGEIDSIIADMKKERETDPNLIKNKAGNWMTFDKLLLTKRYANSTLTKVLREYLNQYRLEILGVTDNELEITESWVNFCQKGAGHHMHNHFNSVVSGTFYLDLKEGEGGELVIVDNRNRGTIHHRAEPNYHNVSEIYITPKKYDLLLFPSYMYHYATPNTSDVIRKSLAFNSFYTNGICADPVGRSCTGIDFTLNTP
jgi:uncharacterized protein (TIGR02466 family)